MRIFEMGGIRAGKPAPGSPLGSPLLSSFVLTLVLAGIPEFVRARTGVQFVPHPGWILVLALSARFGSTGFFTGLLAAAAGVGLGGAFTGAGLTPAWSRLHSAPDMIALAACLVVSWVAAWHLRLQEELSERLRAASGRVAEIRAANAALQGVVTKLRTRVDRSSTSLSFLRDVATRLEGGDPIAAAEAAADLALARTGANAAAVRVKRNGHQQFLIVRDARGHATPEPLALHDAELTVPIHDGKECVGNVVLWGVRRSDLDEPATHDLEIVAEWLAPSTALTRWRPAGATARVRRVL